MPLKSRFKIPVVLAFTILVTPAYAQTVFEKGMATVSYSGWSLAASQRQLAFKEATSNALEGYVANTDPARARIFESKRDQFLSNIDDYVLGTTVLTETQDKASKTYTVVVRTEINAARLMNDLGAGSASATDAASTAHPTITFLFVARSQASIQSFDDKVYARTDTDNTMSRATNEDESIRTHSIGTSDQSETHNSTATTTGGSVTRKAEKVEWTIGNASEIDTAMTGVFSDAGFDVADADQVEGASGGLLNIADIRSAYSDGDDLPPTVMYKATQGVRQAGVNYFALGTLDVGMPDHDPVSGNVRVIVTVTGKVFGLQQRFARTLVAIGPVQYAGMGPNPTVARTNALNEAATQVAHEMVDDLHNKGVN